MSERSALATGCGGHRQYSNYCLCLNCRRITFGSTTLNLTSSGIDLCVRTPCTLAIVVVTAPLPLIGLWLFICQINQRIKSHQFSINGKLKIWLRKLMRANQDSRPRKTTLSTSDQREREGKSIGLFSSFKWYSFEAAMHDARAL